MTREEMHDLVLKNFVGLTSMQYAFNWDDIWDWQYGNRGRFVAKGSVEDVVALLDLRLNPPDVSSLWADYQEEYPWEVVRWIIGWILLRPDVYRDAFNKRVGDPSHWTILLKICRESLYPENLIDIASILRESASQNLLTPELRDEILKVQAIILDEISGPDFHTSMRSWIDDYNCGNSPDWLKVPANAGKRDYVRWRHPLEQ